MRQRAICKVADCDKPRVTGAMLCADHLGGKRRCEGRVTEVDPATGEVLGERQCKRSAKPGLLVCQSHGGDAPKLKAVSARTPALTAMQRFVQPYDGPLDPITAFEKEFRRTYGRILWLEDQIAGFEDEKDLIYGLVKEESITATEFAGTNRTYEAKIHVYEDMLRWERKHFLELEKTYIRANLDERRLGMMREYLEGTYASVTRLLTDLGHDTSTPEVRDKMRRMFEGGE
jgi:hypothetical protein